MLVRPNLLSVRPVIDHLQPTGVRNVEVGGDEKVKVTVTATIRVMLVARVRVIKAVRVSVTARVTVTVTVVVSVRVTVKQSALSELAHDSQPIVVGILTVNLPCRNGERVQRRGILSNA